MDPGVRPHAYCGLCGRRVELGAAAGPEDALQRCGECGRWVCGRCWDPEADSCVFCSGAIERRTSADPAILEARPWSGRRFADRKRRARKQARQAGQAARGREASVDASRRSADLFPEARAGRRRRGRLFSALLVAVVALVVVGVVGIGVVLYGGLPTPSGDVAGVTGQPDPTAESSPSPVPSSPAAELSPSPSPLPTSPPSASPSPSVSIGSAPLAVVGTSVRGWPERTGGSGFHIVAAVENRSPSTLRLVATDATYRLVGNGPPVTGRFRYAVPDAIEPGERGYLIDSVPIDAALARGQPTVEVTTGDGDPAPDFPQRLYVSGIAWTAGPSGLRVIGQATNLTGRPVLQGVAAAVAVDAAGLPIAGVVDLTDLSPLDANQQRAFELDQPQTGPIDPSEVARVVVFAFDLER